MKIEEWEDECDAHMLKAGGVYAIVDEDNNVIYVGEAQCFIARWGEHCGPKRNKAIPTEKVHKFVVLRYEEDRAKRVVWERLYTSKYKPKHYRSSAQSFLRQNDLLLNKYKLRELSKQGHIQSRQCDPSPQVETYDEALEDELRHLNTNTE